MSQERLTQPERGPSKPKYSLEIKSTVTNRFKPEEQQQGVVGLKIPKLIAELGSTMGIPTIEDSEVSKDQPL